MNAQIQKQTNKIASERFCAHFITGQEEITFNNVAMDCWIGDVFDHTSNTRLTEDTKEFELVYNALDDVIDEIQKFLIDHYNLSLKQKKGGDI